MATPRKLCIFSDGSWNNPEFPIPTNVLNLALSVKYLSSECHRQVVLYDSGIGTDDSPLDFVNGAIGKGVDLKVRELYTFLAMNYHDGDDICLFGFSRGSYTVRALSEMMYVVGLVTRDKLREAQKGYALYREGLGFDSDEAVEFRAEHSRTVPIKLLAVYDTVGPLELPWPMKNFIDAVTYKLQSSMCSPEIENGIHLLSIDEDRGSFWPITMEPHPSCGKEQVTQIFLPGYHNGIGAGGDGDEQLLANNGLKIMVEEILERGIGIEFDMEKIPKEWNLSVAPMWDGKEAPIFSDYYKLKVISGGSKIRRIDSVEQLHWTAVQRYQTVENWRPKALQHLQDNILAVKI